MSDRRERWCVLCYVTPKEHGGLPDRDDVKAVSQHPGQLVGLRCRGGGGR